MRYRQSYGWKTVGLGVGAVLALAGVAVGDTSLWLAGGVCVVVGVAQAQRYCRCPGCGRGLGHLRRGIPAHCPYCDRSL